MRNFTCNHCGKSWSSTEILTSIQDFGFINLTSQDEEIIAFSCPDVKCHYLVYCKGQLGISGEFLNDLEMLSDVKGRVFINQEFKYYASLPTPEENTEIINSLNAVLRTFTPSDNYENDLLLCISEMPELVSTDYYCSFNDNLLGIMGCSLNVWWYKKDNLENFLNGNNPHHLRIFPRYIKSHALLEHIDRFYWDQYFNKSIFGRREGTVFSHMIYSWNKDDIAKQYNFLDLLTPPRCLLGRNDDELVNTHHESNSIWQHFHSSYVQEQLLSQSELFLTDYLEQYSKPDFTIADVEELISGYRSLIYKGLISRRKRDSVEKETIEKLIERADQEAPEFKSIISADKTILRLKVRLTQLCKNTKNPLIILLVGESGNGKTMFGNAIHSASGRPGRFVSVNTSSIAPDLFESHVFGHKKGAFTGAASDNEGYFKFADHGTLLLDEFGEIAIDLQAKLLKAVEEGVIQPVGSSESIKVDVQLVLGTNINFEKSIENGTFRKDLYYRINKLKFEIPPLRNRKKDILLLANHFIKKRAGTAGYENMAEVRIADEAKDFLLSCQWPGNARQLENVIDGLLLFRDLNDRSDIGIEEIKGWIPPTEQKSICLGKKSDPYEEHFLTDADIKKVPVVKPAPGNRDMPSIEDVVELLEYFNAKEKKKRGLPKKIADVIGVSERYFKYWIKKHNIVYPWRK